MTKVEDANAAAILNLDASRRVGWAKSYALQDKLDGAVADGEMWRTDSEAFRHALSYVCGLVMEIFSADQRHAVRLVVEEAAGFDAVLDQTKVSYGRRRARRLINEDPSFADPVETEQLRVMRDNAKRAKRRASKQYERAAKDHAELVLARDYGFETTQQMHGVLRKWQEATGAKRRSLESIRERSAYEAFMARQKRRQAGLGAVAAKGAARVARTPQGDDGVR